MESSDVFTDDDIKEQFVAGAMLNGVAYNLGEAREWFDEWLEINAREMQAQALIEAASEITDGMNLRVHHALRERAARIRDGKRRGE